MILKVWSGKTQGVDVGCENICTKKLKNGAPGKVWVAGENDAKHCSTVLIIRIETITIKIKVTKSIIAKLKSHPSYSPSGNQNLINILIN